MKIDIQSRQTDKAERQSTQTNRLKNIQSRQTKRQTERLGQTYGYTDRHTDSLKVSSRNKQTDKAERQSNRQRWQTVKQGQTVGDR